MTGVALLAPASALAIVFFVTPIVVVVWNSLTDTPLIGTGTFVGLANYVALASDPTFLQSMRFGAAYTAISSVIVVVSSYVLGIVARFRHRAAPVLRSFYLLPYVIGISTLSYMALLEFRPGYGSINQLLDALGLTDGQTTWLIRPGLALWAVSLVTAWASVGFGMVLLMSSMQAVPHEVLEAARVDGAGWLTRERLVVMPMVRRSLALVSITTVAGNFLAFTQFFILTQGGPGTQTATPVIVAYKTTIQHFHLGYASAISVVLLVVVALLSAAQFGLLRAGGSDD